MRHSYAAVALLLLVFAGVVKAQPAAQPVLQVTVGSPTGTPITYNQSASGTTRDFGSQDVNAGPTASITFYISNTGTAALDVAGLSLGGANWADFVLDPTGMDAQVAPGHGTSFTLAFDPSAAGPKQAFVRITHNDPNSQTPYDIPVLGNATSTTVIASELRVVTQPGNEAAGVTFATDPVIAVTDGAGSVDTSDNSSQVTVGILIGTGNSAATLSGTQTLTVTNGYATFTGLSIDKPGSGYRLTFWNTNGSLAADVSTPFDVTGNGSSGSGSGNGNGSGNNGTGLSCSSAAQTGYVVQVVLMLCGLALVLRRLSRRKRSRS